MDIEQHLVLFARNYCHETVTSSKCKFTRALIALHPFQSLVQLPPLLSPDTHTTILQPLGFCPGLPNATELQSEDG